MYKFVRQSYIGEVDIWDVVAHSPEVVLPAYVLRLHLDPEERSSMFLRNFVQLENFKSLLSEPKIQHIIVVIFNIRIMY
jgi:hypothetical protein